MGKERVKVYDVQRQDSKSSYRFSVQLSMSEGPMYLVGFRLLDDGRMVSPSAKAGTYWIPLVVLPKNLRAAVKNKALAAIAKGVVNDSGSIGTVVGSSDISHDNVGDRQTDNT